MMAFKMAKIFQFAAAVLSVFLLPAGFSSAASQPPVVGGVLPEFTLPVPRNEIHRQYLGVAGKKTFTIPEIKAEVVVIEIFSMY